MKILIFKTNIHCSSCIERVRPILDEKIGSGNWKVDISSDEKLLNINTDKYTADKIIGFVAKLGYCASLKE